MRRVRMRIGAGVLVGVVAASSSGCFVARAWSAVFRPPPPDVPVPSYASTPAAGLAFDAIRDAWRVQDDSKRADVKGMVLGFLARYPQDGLAPLARVYLALLALDDGDLPTAGVAIDETASLPSGATHDLWTVACARRERLEGRSEAALELLRPLVGKNVDPVTRSVFEQELALAALGTGRDYEAVSYMDAWIRATPEEDADRVQTRVTALVEKLPQPVLVGALQAMRAQRASFGYGVTIERILAQRLVRIATSTGDPELARMLLDADAGALVVAGDAGVELGQLATSRRGLNVVEGRTIGLLLPTESSALRDESAEVLRGVMWALGLPRGSRTLGAAPATSADERSTARSTSRDMAPRHAPCARGEAAPDPGEPAVDDHVRLVTRNDAGTVDRTEGSLDELAGAGAAVIVAGLDPVTSQRVLRWGEAHQVPVIALAPPEEPLEPGFSFAIGEPRATVLEALAAAAPTFTGGPTAAVVDASDVGAFAPQGGRVGLFELLPVVSCDIPPARAGDPRFPVGPWSRDRVSRWLVTGSPGCARDLLADLGTSHARGALALALEAAGAPAHAAGLRVVTASAGVVPFDAVGDARDEELRRFVERSGRPGWWTALGRDAGTLARIAVRQLPDAPASDLDAVTKRRADARDRLRAAHAPLWSTESVGWTSAHRLARTVCAFDAER